MRENTRGAGGIAGVLASTRATAGGQLFAKATRFQLGDVTTAVSAGLLQRLTLTRWLALEARTTYERDFGRAWFLGSAGLRAYF